MNYTPNTTHLSILWYKYPGSPHETFKRACKTDITMQLLLLGFIHWTKSLRPEINDVLSIQMPIGVVFLIWAFYLLLKCPADNTTRMSEEFKNSARIYGWAKLIYNGLVLMVFAGLIVVLMYGTFNFWRYSPTGYGGILALALMAILLILASVQGLFFAVQFQLGRSILKATRTMDFAQVIQDTEIAQ